MSILEVRQLSKVYGDKQAFQEVLKEINLDVDEGEFISIMGPSGSGKTTLLNVLSSIDYMTKGSITINGKQLEKLSNKQLSDIRKKDIGFIFQDYNILNTLTVKENIMLPLSVQKLDKSTLDLLKRLKYMNEEFNTTILMVTHDPVAASFSNRVVMLKDGQIFTELYQGDDDKQTFYKEIIRTQSVLGGINYEL